MDPILQLLTQPWFIVLVAVGVFVGRVMYLAKRLRSSARHPTLADLRALDEAKAALDKHHESLDEAKSILAGNLGGARDTLRTYKRPLNSAIEDRRKDIESTMRSLDTAKDAQKREFDKVRGQPAYADAKRLYKTALPRKTHRQSTKEM